MKEKDNHLPSNPDIPFEHQMLHILRSYGRLQAENLRLREELRRASAVPVEDVAQNNEVLRQDNARLRRAMRSLEETLKAKRGSFKLMHEQIKNRDQEIARLRLQLRLLTEKGVGQGAPRTPKGPATAGHDKTRPNLPAPRLNEA